MKKIIIILLSILLIIYLFFNYIPKKFKDEINLFEEFGEEAIVKENFKNNETKVVFSKKDLNKTINLILEVDYLRVKNYKYNNSNILYKIIDNDSRIIILEENGIVIGKENLKKYYIKKNDLYKILDYLKTKVDEKDINKMNISKSDFDYINNNFGKDISFIEFFKRLNIDTNGIVMKRLNLSVSRNGYIKSLNITFYDKKNTKKYILVYNKSYKKLKLNEFKLLEKDFITATSNNKILASVDYLLRELDKVDSYNGLKTIELVEPYEIEINRKDKIVYFNGEITNNEKIKGITFNVNSFYTPKGIGVDFYIFGDNNKQ